MIQQVKQAQVRTISIEGLANKIQSKYVRFFEKKIVNQLQGNNRITVNDSMMVGELAQGNHPFQKYIPGFRPPIVERSQIDRANSQSNQQPQLMDTIDFSMIRHEGERGSDATLALFDEFDKNMKP